MPVWVFGQLRTKAPIRASRRVDQRRHIIQKPLFVYISVMNSKYTVHAAQYFTATIYEWQPVLATNFGILMLYSGN
jgi:hypothetical protein